MISAKNAIKLLKDGNKRFAENKSVHPNLDKKRRLELLSEQKPFAIIIACSDSRIPVEIIFDTGLGDLFVIRTAGQVLSQEVLGSADYAVSLGVKLLVILGHDDCGAIKSAISEYKNEKQNDLPENLQSLLKHIYPVIDKIDNNENNLVNKAILSNINYQIKYLKENDKYLSQKIDNNKIKLVGAKYDLKSGTVAFYE